MSASTTGYFGQMFDHSLTPLKGDLVSPFIQ